jgi:hypothetical protein
LSEGDFPFHRQPHNLSGKSMMRRFEQHLRDPVQTMDQQTFVSRRVLLWEEQGLPWKRARMKPIHIEIIDAVEAGLVAQGIGQRLRLA